MELKLLCILHKITAMLYNVTTNLVDCITTI